MWLGPRATYCKQPLPRLISSICAVDLASRKPVHRSQQVSSQQNQFGEQGDRKDTWVLTIVHTYLGTYLLLVWPTHTSTPPHDHGSTLWTSVTLKQRSPVFAIPWSSWSPDHEPIIVHRSFRWWVCALGGALCVRRWTTAHKNISHASTTSE